MPSPDGAYRWVVWLRVHSECRAIVDLAREDRGTVVRVCHRWRWHRGPCHDLGRPKTLYHWQQSTGPAVQLIGLRPWPGYCQACGAALDPLDARHCRTCHASDDDE
jgi:hypothetical protein